MDFASVVSISSNLWFVVISFSYVDHLVEMQPRNTSRTTTH